MKLVATGLRIFRTAPARAHARSDELLSIPSQLLGVFTATEASAAFAGMEARAVIPGREGRTKDAVSAH
jgi:hypothetical protein